jgi:nucleoside-diphosphate-sugar epimerase
MPGGRLDTRRDFVDVRDVARALLALALHGGAGQLYHVGTGVSRSVGDGLDDLVERSGRSIVTREDPELMQRPGPLDSRAAIDRIARTTGWEPRISFEQSLQDLWCEIRDRQAFNPWRGTVQDPRWRLPLTA